MTTTEEKRFNDIYDDLVLISHTNASQFHPEVINLPGHVFTSRNYLGKTEMYISKSGKAKKAFLCPARFKGCDFKSDKATSVKRHLSGKGDCIGCKVIAGAEKPKQARKKITVDKVVFDYEDDEVKRLMFILGEKMSRIDRRITEQYDGAHHTWDIRSDNGSRHTHYGIKSSPALLLVDWFKNWLIPYSSSWGPTKLMKSYDNGKVGCRFMDKGLHFYYIDEDEKWIKLKREEALPFLIQRFKNLFTQVYEKYNSDWGKASTYFWHEILTGDKHTNELYEEIAEMDLYYDDLGDLSPQERMYYEAKRAYPFKPIKTKPLLTASP